MCNIVVECIKYGRSARQSVADGGVQTSVVLGGPDAAAAADARTRGSLQGPQDHAGNETC